MTDKLNAIGSIQAGFSMGDAVAGRKLQQQSLMQDQQKIDMLREETQFKRQQQLAKERLGVEGFNNQRALIQLAAVDPEYAKTVAQQRDSFNRKHYSAIDNVTAQPPERQQAAWDMERAQLEAAGIDMSDISAKYSPEVAQQLQQFKTQLRTWDPVFESIDTARGIAAFDKTTGETRLTGEGVYVKPASTIVNVGGEQPAFRKKLEETYGIKTAEKMDNIQTAADNALEIKSYLNLQREALANLENTGPLDSGKIFLGNLINQFGIEGVDMSKVSSLEQLSAAAKTITIPLVKKLGYNPTDADARLIGATIADIGKGKATNEQLINLLDQIADKQIAKAAIVDELRAQGREGELSKALREYDKANPIKLLSQKTSDLTAKSGSAPEIKEGDTITNKATGQRMKLVGGKWQPL